MTMANFDREKEKLWYPIISGCLGGITNIQLADEQLDMQEATDVEVTWRDLPWYFSIRIRDESSAYSPYHLERYKQEFTIRYSRPGTDNKYIEWHKLFRAYTGKPDYICYGWRGAQGLADWVILDIRRLSYLRQRGTLIETGEHLNTDAKQSSFKSYSLESAWFAMQWASESRRLRIDRMAKRLM